METILASVGLMKERFGHHTILTMFSLDPITKYPFTYFRFSTQGEKPLSRNDRYASRGKGSQRSQKDEEKRRRLEDEKRRMEEKKKNMQDDAFRMMKEMEDLLLKQKAGEERKRKEEEERKKKAKAEAEIRKYDSM